MTGVLKYWNVDPVSVRRVSGGFSGASVFCVADTRNRMWALRQTPRHVIPDLARRKSVAGYLRGLGEAGFEQIAIPQTCRHGMRNRESAISPTDVVDHDGVWCLEEWKAGSPAQAETLDDVMVTDAIELIRRIHDWSCRWARYHADANLSVAVRPSDAVRRRLEIATSLQAGELSRLRAAVARRPPEIRDSATMVLDAIERSLPRLSQMLTRISRAPFPVQPVIGDVWSAHVLFTESRVTGLIDFWNCRSDHPWVDFARLFRSWFGGDHSRVRDAWQQNLAGRVPQSSEHDLLESLDHTTVLFSPLRWLRQLVRPDFDIAAYREAAARFRELACVAADFKPVAMLR